MDNTIAEQSAELINYPGYIAILDGVREEIETIQKELLEARDSYQVFKLTRDWQILQRLYNILSTRPNEIRNALLEARETPIHEAFQGQMNQYARIPVGED